MSVEVEITVMVTVKAYPGLSTKHGEVVCVAGVRVDSGEPVWARLWPVAFRDLDLNDRFAKYQLVTLRARQTGHDLRPESWRPSPSPLKVGDKISSSHQWRDRWAVLAPLAGQVTMCELQRRQALDASSLGLVRVKAIHELEITPNEEYSAEKAEMAKEAAEATLFRAARDPLEPPPYTMRYHYTCMEPGCGGHRQGYIDWEAAQASRRWRREYGNEDRTVAALRQKFVRDVFDGRDTHFYVGNMHQAPRAFLVLGVFWPPEGSRPLPRPEALF